MGIMADDRPILEQRIDKLFDAFDAGQVTGDEVTAEIVRLVRLFESDETRGGVR